MKNGFTLKENCSKAPLFALATPFEKNGAIHFSALGDYLDFLSGHGVNRIITNGTTGEFASLTLRERMTVLEYCRSRFKGEIINHTGACAVEDCHTLLRHSAGLADGILILPPFYYAEAPASGLMVFFEEVLSETSLPVYLYNFPRHTKNKISTEMLYDLKKKFSSLRGIKDSGGDISLSQEYKTSSPELEVYVGGDGVALKVLEMGLDGSVTGGGNPVPECLVGICRAFEKDNLEGAKEWQGVLDIWTRFRKEMPLAEIPMVKAGLKARIQGFPIHIRPPFPPLQEEEVTIVASHIQVNILPIFPE